MDTTYSAFTNIGILFLCIFSNLACLSADEEYAFTPPQNEIVFALAFSPDGKSFAAVQSNKVHFYDTDTGKLLRSITSKSNLKAVLKIMTDPPFTDGPMRDIVSDLDFSPDGKILAGCRSDRTICLWDMTKKEKPVILEGHDGSVTCGRFSPDASVFASGSHDCKIYLWDYKKKKVQFSLEGHNGPLQTMAFSPKGDLLASGTENQIILWDLGTKKEIHRFIIPTGGPARTLRFTPDGKTLVAGNRDGIVRIWDVDKWTEKKISLDEWLNHGKKAMPPSIYGLAVLADNRTLITACDAGIIVAWDLEQLKEIGSLKIKCHVQSMALSPDQKKILCGGYGNFNLREGGMIQLIEVDHLLKKKE
jgi:WD40 repeat protein